jgi:hypothetical protein
MHHESELDQALITAMIERASHLEDVLVTSLLGLLITTTFGFVVAIYTLHKESTFWRQIDKRWFLIGIAFIYMCISGYYYYMLAHFYAAVQSAFALIVTPSTQSGVAPIWSLFRLPEWFGLSAKERSIGYLAIAPLFPVGFSCIAITAFWLAIKPDWQRQWKSSVASWIIAIMMQIVLAYLLAAYPFRTFTRAIAEYIDRQEVGEVTAQP